jgi:hypothetical protein
MSKGPKVRYSEAEAALRLGVSVKRLREMVRELLMTDPEASPVQEFRRTDLVMLQVLAARRQMVRTG